MNSVHNRASIEEKVWFIGRLTVVQSNFLLNFCNPIPPHSQVAYCWCLLVRYTTSNDEMKRNVKCSTYCMSLLQQRDLFDFCQLVFLSPPVHVFTFPGMINVRALRLINELGIPGVINEFFENVYTDLARINLDGLWSTSDNNVMSENHDIISKRAECRVLMMMMVMSIIILCDALVIHFILCFNLYSALHVTRDFRCNTWRYNATGTVIIKTITKMIHHTSAA